MNTRYITYILLGILLVLSFFLIFKNLSNNFLWEDEAESAVLARNILHFGYPRAFDGINQITPTVYAGFGKEYQWKFHPWLPFYIVAFSQAVLGESAFSSRLPFAIFGFLSIILLFFLTRRLFKKDSIALLTTLFASTSIPFILLMRQCRYYGLLVFLVLCIVWAYLKILEKKTGYLWLLGILLVALCYTNHGAFIPVSLTILIHSFFLNKEKVLSKKIILMFIAVSALAIPWFIYSYAPNHLAGLKLIALKKNLEFEIRVLNKYIFPLSFFIILYAIYCFKNKTWKIKINPEHKKNLALILLLIAVNLSFYILVEQRTIRYYIHLFPFLYMLEAYLFLTFLSKRKILLTILISAIIFTNILNSSFLLKKVKFYLPMYLYEITHDYDGPVEGTVKFLKQYAKPGDTVKVAYDGNSLIFYLPFLKIENDYFFNRKDFPKWIVWRDYWINEYKNYNAKQCSPYDEGYLSEIKAKYTAHVIPYPDIIWENRPDDMEYHKFKTSDDPRKVIIYERKEL